MVEPAPAVDGPFASRRRFLQAAAPVTWSAVVAGCGSPGAGAGTEGSPTASGTGSPLDTTDTGTAGRTTDAPTDAGVTDTGTEPAADGDAASVRAAHLSPNAPNVDVSVDGAAVLEDLAFGTVSEYRSLDAGTHAVEITTAGDGGTVGFDGEVAVGGGRSYTVAAIGEVGGDADRPVEVLVLADDNSPLGGDTARLRVLHASPDASAVDVSAGETVLFESVAFGDSGYVEVPAGSYTVTISAAGATEPPIGTATASGGDLAEFDLSLAGGQRYAAFAAGYVTPGDEPADVPFDLILTRDTAAATGTAIGAATATGTPG